MVADLKHSFYNDNITFTEYLIIIEMYAICSDERNIQ